MNYTVHTSLNMGLTLYYTLTTKESDSLFVCLLFLADGLCHPIYTITGLMWTCKIKGKQDYTTHKAEVVIYLFFGSCC